MEGHHFGFLGLPLELRNLIYANVFSSSVFGNFPILRVCRQIYHEAREIALRDSTLVCHPTSRDKLRVARKEGLQSLEDTCKMLGSKTSRIRIVEICSCNSSMSDEPTVEGYVAEYLAELRSCGIELRTLSIHIDILWFENDLLSPEHFGGLSSVPIAERLLTKNANHPRLREVQFLCKLEQHHGMFDEDREEWEKQTLTGPDLGSCLVDWPDKEIEEDNTSQDGNEPDNTEDALHVNDAEEVDLSVVEISMRSACQHYKVIDPSIRLSVFQSPLQKKYGGLDLILCVSKVKL